MFYLILVFLVILDVIINWGIKLLLASFFSVFQRQVKRLEKYIDVTKNIRSDKNSIEILPKYCRFIEII